MIRRFGMQDSKPSSLPADPFTTLPSGETSNDSTHSASFPYREAVGCLMYAMICTRPDIAYALSQVAKFCENPTEVHWQAVKKIMAYLKNTAGIGFCFYSSSYDNQLLAFSDSDFAGDHDTRRSTTGFVLMLNGGPIA